MELKEVLHFDEKNHKYTLEGPNYSRDLISVTQLMQKHGLAPSYAGVSTEVLNAKAERGSLIHKEIEEFIKKKEIGFTEEMIEFKDYVEGRKIKKIQSEQKVHNDIVAGTIDLVFEDGKQPVIADIKTTYQLHMEAVSWQLSIYLWLYLDYDLRYADANWDGFKAQAFHFNKDGELNVVDIPLKPMEEIEKLMECERKGEIYKYEIDVVDINDTQIEKIAELEQIIKDLDSQVKEAKQKQDELKGALLQEMESRGLKSFEKGNLKITYVAPSTRTTLDSKAIKEKYPEIYEENAKTTDVKASLKITLKGEK